MAKQCLLYRTVLTYFCLLFMYFFMIAVVRRQFIIIIIINEFHRDASLAKL